MRRRSRDTSFYRFHVDAALTDTRFRDAIHARFNDEPTVEARAYFDGVLQARPDIAESLLKKIAGAKSYQKLREAFGEVELGYDLISKGVRVHNEPVVTGTGDLEFRTPRDGEKNCDYAVWPSSRPVAVEIKTPVPDDQKANNNVHAIREEFRQRVERVRAAGGRKQNISLIIGTPAVAWSKRRGEFGKELEVQLKRLLQIQAPARPMEMTPVEIEGQVIGHVTFFPGDGGIMTGGPSRGVPPFEPDNIIDRKQLPKNSPSVVVFNLRGELLPLPIRISEAFAGHFSPPGAFNNPKWAKLSAVLLYGGNGHRELLLNPMAGLPLSDAEAAFFESDHPPP